MSKSKKILELYDDTKRHDFDYYYVVFERPYLQSFLDYIFDKFNVYVWTAASKDYALYIIGLCVIRI